MTFNTREFEFSHGHKPKGFGMWAFFFDAKTDTADAFFTQAMNYGEAKKVARAEAKRRGASEVTVGS